MRFVMGLAIGVGLFVAGLIVTALGGLALLILI